LSRWIDRQWLASSWNARNAIWLRLLWIAPVLIAVLLLDLFNSQAGSTTTAIVLGIAFALCLALMTWSGSRFFKGYGSSRRSDKMVKAWRKSVEQRRG
jgi:hypothetical protein